MWRSPEDEARVRMAMEAARAAEQKNRLVFGLIARVVQGVRPATVGETHQGAEGQPMVLMVVRGPETWMGKGKNRHLVAGQASLVLRSDGSKVFRPGRLADPSGGVIELRELRVEAPELVGAGLKAIITDKRRRARAWRGNPRPKSLRRGG